MVDKHADRTRLPLVLLLIAALVGRPGIPLAQTVSRAVEFDDLGLTTFIDVSPRSAVLAGFAATTPDATALVYNPAGLAPVKRMAASLTLSGRRTEFRTVHDGSAATHTEDRYGLQFAGGAVPVAVMRGSFVPAAGVYRAFVSDLDVEYAGYNQIDDRDEAFLLQQSGSTFAFALGAGVDLSSALSAGFSVFFLEGGFDALRQSDYTRRGSPVHTYVVEDAKADVGGVGGRFGVKVFAHRHLQIGVNFTTPTVVDVEVEQTREVTTYVANDVGSFERSTFSTSTRYVLAHRIDGSVALPWGRWLVGFQAGLADWGQATIDEHRLLLPSADPVMERIVEWRAGLEWSAPQWPLRLRAGVAHLPFATRYLQADRIDNDQLTKCGSSSVLGICAGASAMWRASITVDASFSRASGGRESASVEEHRAWSEILIQGTYWF